MHIAPLIHDLAIILGVAGLVSLLFRKIKQPLVVGYLIAGMIVGPHTPPFPLVTDIDGIRIWAELGVIFLMFSLGLEFSFRKLAKAGLSAGFTAGFEVLFMLVLGFFTGKMLHFPIMDCLFLGAILSISSTTIIIKALDELHLKMTRFAELIFAILVVEDLIAILVLVTLSTIAIKGTLSGLVLAWAMAKLILVVGGWFIAGYFIVPKFIKYVGQVGSVEVLTVIALGLCLALVLFSVYFQYSSALGAFIMGSILAESTVSHKIQERIEPLRDLFAAVFFVSIGMLLDPMSLWKYRSLVIIISLVTILGKTMATTLGALITGQPLRTSIQVGFGLAQIGEFSFIIATLGMSLHATSEFLYPIAVAVSLVTTFATPFMIRISKGFSDVLVRKLPKKMLLLLERYSISLQEKRIYTQEKYEFYRLLLKRVLNALIVSIIFVISSNFITSTVSQYSWGDVPIEAVAFLIAMILSAPFIWAMFFTFDKISSALFSKFNLALISRVIAALLLCILSLAFFPLKIVIAVTSLLVIGLFSFFFRYIEAAYLWFEKHFLLSFEGRNQEVGVHALHHLAPWDAHLIRILVQPGTLLVMKQILDTHLRSQYGVNIVAIQRGEDVIVAPKATEVIFPYDELLVLGSDEQIEKIRPLVEKRASLQDPSERLEEYELRQFRLSENCPFSNKSLKMLDLSKQFQIIVVGLESGDRRQMNPHPDTLLNSGDILWAVGKRDQLDSFYEASKASVA